MKALLLVSLALLSGCSTLGLRNPQTLFRCSGVDALIVCPRGETPMVTGIDNKCLVVGTANTTLPTANCRTR